MGERRETRAAFTDISNIIGAETSPADEELLKREERNRKQREYRARKRAEESIEQREERNRKQREYRASKIELTTSTTPRHGGQSLQESVVSAIYQASRNHDEENYDPNESSNWLHRNDEYVRRQRPPLSPLQTESSNGIVINTGASSSTAKLLKSRNWYLNMDAPTKEKLLQQRRDYKKAKATENEQRACPTLAQEENVHPMLGPPVQPRYVEPNDVEFDSALFEPTNHDSDDEGHLHDIGEEGWDIGEALTDFETVQFLGEECAFQSYRVNDDCTGHGAADDPYDFVYHNLPERHHVLKKVPDCRYCGSMRFEGEPPGFCCRKGKIRLHIHDVPAELKRLFTSQLHNDG